MLFGHLVWLLLSWIVYQSIPHLPQLWICSLSLISSSINEDTTHTCPLALMGLRQWAFYSNLHSIMSFFLIDEFLGSVALILEVDPITFWYIINNLVGASKTINKGCILRWLMMQTGPAVKLWLWRKLKADGWGVHCTKYNIKLDIHQKFFTKLPFVK